MHGWGARGFGSTRLRHGDRGASTPWCGRHPGVSDGAIVMPCKIRPPKSQRTPPTFYELEDMRRIIDAAKTTDARTHALVLIGLHGGLRRGEILGLEWADVNLSRREITVRRNVISKYVDVPKNGHGRVLDLSAELTDALAALAAASPKSGRVFRQESGRPALAKHLYKWTEAAKQKAGIPSRKGVRLHVMRHSACSALAAMGAPTIAIQTFAGHETPHTTEKYMHVAPGLQSAAIRPFDSNPIVARTVASVATDETIR